MLKGREKKQKGEDRQEWLDQSIKQSVSEWKKVLQYHARPEGDKPQTTWVDQEIKKATAQIQPVPV